MLCLAVEKLPEAAAWQYELKLDGYRAIGVRTKKGVEVWSRNKRDFSRRFSTVARALALLVETVLDGEIVAVNGDGRASFSSLQNSRGDAAAILFYAFDAPVLAGEDWRSNPHRDAPGDGPRADFENACLRRGRSRRNRIFRWQ
jgi:bifunctional non-homologous end joining protein LigD